MMGRTMAALMLVIIPLSAMAQGSSAEQTARARREVVERVADLIDHRYVDPVAGKRIARDLRRDPSKSIAGDTSAAFAKSFTDYLRTLSGDGHFALDFDPSHEALPDGETADQTELNRWYGPQVNYGFEQVARLDNGVGYLDLRVFAPTEMGGDLAAAAMSLLAQSPALIIDLRRNGGGMGEMTHLLAGYLLDEIREMSADYDRPNSRTTRHFTPAKVPGRRFGGIKPVYILVSKRTFSAAEAFAYDLQAMKRAIVIGEQTGGGAHPFFYRPAGHGFVLSLPEQRSINPITGGDWEGVGVTPDIRVSADTALDQALAEATNNLSKKAMK